MFIPLNYILIIEKQIVGLLFLLQISDKIRNTTQVIVRHRICLQTDGRTDMVKPVYPPTTSLRGGIKKHKLCR